MTTIDLDTNPPAPREPHNTPLILALIAARRWCERTAARFTAAP